MAKDKTEKEDNTINNFISTKNHDIYDKENYHIYNKLVKESNNYNNSNNKLVKESNNYNNSNNELVKESNNYKNSNNELAKESIEKLKSFCKKYDEENKNRKNTSTELKHPPKKGQSR